MFRSKMFAGSAGFCEFFCESAMRTLRGQQQRAVPVEKTGGYLSSIKPKAAGTIGFAPAAG